MPKQAMPTRGQTRVETAAELPLAVWIDAERRRVRVRSSALKRGQASRRLAFLQRAFACPDVESIWVDAHRSSAEIRLLEADPQQPATFASVVGRLAAAIRDAAAGRDVVVPRDCLDRAVVTVRRLGSRLTTWQVGSDRPDVLRMRHPRLRRDRTLVRRLERLVGAVPGILAVQVASWTADLLVRFDPARLDADTLLAVVQHAVDEQAGTALGSSPWEMVKTSTTLGVAAATDFLLPGLAPLYACLLLGGNVRTISAVAGDIRRKKVGMPTLATAIILGTLATGQFLASGIMAWSFDFWRRRHRRDIEAERRLLLDDAVPLPACLVGRSVDGGWRTRSATAVQAGDEIDLDRWDVVPVDGAVVTGGGVIDDRCVSGVSGVRPVAVGERVLAGSMLLGGRLTIRADGTLLGSRMAGIAALVGEATIHRPGRVAATATAERFAEELAGPTLATAALGLLAGDVTTAVAIMRPDYASAEAVAVSLEDLDAVACGLAAGFVLTSPAALDALDAIDTLLMVDHPALSRRLLAVSAVDVHGIDEREALRWGASLARHLACDRREALDTAARRAGLPLIDLVPEQFGSDAGIGIVARQGRRCLRLLEAEDSSAPVIRGLVLELDGRTVARFSFGFSPERRGGQLVERLRQVRDIRIILQANPQAAGSSLTGGQLREQMADLRCDEIREAAVGDDVAAAVRALQAAGRRVGLVADSAAVPAAVRIADVVIDVGDRMDSDASRGIAGIVSLSGTIEGLPELLDAARQRRSRLAIARRLNLLPNVACVVGAFLFGFTSLISAVVTNLGTLGIYSRATNRLHHNRRQHWLRHRPAITLEIGRVGRQDPLDPALDRRQVIG